MSAAGGEKSGERARAVYRERRSKKKITGQATTAEYNQSEGTSAETRSSLQYRSRGGTVTMHREGGAGRGWGSGLRSAGGPRPCVLYYTYQPLRHDRAGQTIHLAPAQARVLAFASHTRAHLTRTSPLHLPRRARVPPGLAGGRQIAPVGPYPCVRRAECCCTSCAGRGACEGWLRGRDLQPCLRPASCGTPDAAVLHPCRIAIGRISRREGKWRNGRGALQ